MVKAEPERSEFVKNNLGLVHSLANRFRGRGIEYDDLFSAGCVGLIKAMDGFDEERGLMFSTYAVPVILGEIKRLFRDGGAVKVSRSLKELSFHLSRERDKFAKENFREPTISELSKIMEVSEENVIEALNTIKPPVSLTFTDDEKTTELDIADEDKLDILCEKISLREIVDTLPEKDRDLIVLRYYKGKTQTETAKKLGMTQVQVSRREKKLLMKLRTKLS